MITAQLINGQNVNYTFFKVLQDSPHPATYLFYQDGIGLCGAYTIDQIALLDVTDPNSNPNTPQTS